MPTGRALWLVALAVSAAACTAPGHMTTTTSAANPGWYPPIPRQATGEIGGCAGSKKVVVAAAEVAKIVREVQALPQGDMAGYGPCPSGAEFVGLAPGQERLAAKLLAEYGKDVVLIVGFNRYDGAPAPSPECGQVAAPSPPPPGLHLALQLKHAVVRSGSAFMGTVVVREDGPGRFDMDPGEPLEAVVVRPGTRQVVGVFSGGIGGAGGPVRLTAGQSTAIDAIGGTARCDGGMGSALPPGHYAVVVQVAPEGGVHTPNYLTPPVALQVTAG